MSGLYPLRATYHSPQPNPTQITRETVRYHRSSPREVILNDPFLFPVNHMIGTVTENDPEPIAGPSHTPANTTGTVLDHHEPQGIAAN